MIRGDKDETTLRPAEFYVENKVDLKLGSPATSVDTVAKSVAFADGSTLDYDELVIATGLTPRRIAGLPELSGVHVLRSIEEALALRADLAPGKRALIVGAGFIGCELAASMKSHGVDVVLLEPQPTPLASVLGPTVGALVERLHRNEGIDVRVGTGLTSLSGDGAVAAATLSDGSEIPVDVVAIGVGSVPVTGWLDGSGIELDNGVLCDGVGRTSAEHVWAVGDVASWQIGDRRKRVEHWTNAGDQPRSWRERSLERVIRTRRRRFRTSGAISTTSRSRHWGPSQLRTPFTSSRTTAESSSPTTSATVCWQLSSVAVAREL